MLKLIKTKSEWPCYSDFVNILLLPSLLIYNSACTEMTSFGNERDQVTLAISKDQLIIPIDNRTIQQTYYFQQFQWQGEHYLGWQNRVTNSIELFNLSQKIQLQKINFQKEGPNEITIRGFYFFNPKTLLVRGLYDSFIQYANDKGELTGQRIPLYPDENTTPQYILETPGCPIVKQGERVYFCARSPLDTYLDYYEKFNQSPLGRWVNLSTKETGYVSHNKYPPIYKEIILPSEFWSFSRCVGPHGHFIYSFSIDPYVYEIPESDKVNHIRKYLLAGQQMPNKWPFNKARSDLEDHRYRIETPEYDNIIYDEYRQVYYRFFRLGGEYNQSDNMMTRIKKYQSKPAGIIIADQNLNKIGEVLLPKDRFYIQNWLILPDGLYLSDVHQQNEVSEDMISFTKLNLIKAQ